MRSEIRYFTKTGNTQKLADATAAMHSGKPDEADIQAVKDFVRRITSEA